MSIGLHSKDIATKFTTLQQEIRKRTWFGCILLDRSVFLSKSMLIKSCHATWEYLHCLSIDLQLTNIRRSLSMTFGRPCTIPEDYIRMDLPEHLPLYTSVSDEVQRLSTEFYNASM